MELIPEDNQEKVVEFNKLQVTRVEFDKLRVTRVEFDNPYLGKAPSSKKNR